MARLNKEHSGKKGGKTLKRAQYFFGISFTILVIIIIICIFMGQDGEETMVTEFAIDALIAEFQNDPDFQDWIEIKRRATPFRKDKQWIKNTFEYLRGPNRKWQVVKDKHILFRVNKVYGENGVTPFESDRKLYKEYVEQLDMLLQRFRNKIVKSVVCKNMVSFPTSIDNFEKLAVSYGFNALIKGKGWCGFWPAYNYYKRYEIKNGEMKGKGQLFKTGLDQDGSIIEIEIPLGRGKIDWENLPEDRAVQSEIYKHALKDNLSNPPAWTSSSLDLIFGQDAQTVKNKITEIGKADDAKLKEMYSGDNFDGFSWWYTSFSVGDKDIMIKYFCGDTSMSIKMHESYRLWDIYNTVWGKKVI